MEGGGGGDLGLRGHVPDAEAVRACGVAGEREKGRGGRGLERAAGWEGERDDKAERDGREKGKSDRATERERGRVGVGGGGGARGGLKRERKPLGRRTAREAAVGDERDVVAEPRPCAEAAAAAAD